MNNVIITYNCPDCGQSFPDGTLAHQHVNGEWIRTEDLRSFWSFRRWAGIVESAELEKRETIGYQG